ncbi:MAG: hypothetical protein ABI910_22685, partial [Gemmatimonadota bacterium]
VPGGARGACRSGGGAARGLGGDARPRAPSSYAPPLTLHLLRSACADHDSAAARGYYLELLELAKDGTRRAPLDEARRYTTGAH